jgi:hypothetical protein
MKAYIADSDLHMVCLLDDDTDYIRRVWYFDSLKEAQEYVEWWNETDSLPDLSEQEEKEFLQLHGLDFQDQPEYNGSYI